MRSAALLLSLCLAAPALADGCRAEEYQRVKDKAATEAGVAKLAEAYCADIAKAQQTQQAVPPTSKDVAALRASTALVGACLEDMAMMRDAAAAAGRGAQFAALTNACPKR